MDFIAYRVRTGESPLLPQPAPRTRDWMDETDRHFANRCLPMLIANQAGWVLCAERTQHVIWTGRPEKTGVWVDVPGGETAYTAKAHFGHGIVTWNLPYLFRTPPGWDLLVRGPANLPKDAISPLEGIVEADWCDATFTMNWKFTRVGQWVTFEKGEPICQLVPMPHRTLEQFGCTVRDMPDDVRTAYDTWREHRHAFNNALAAGDPAANKQQWQKHYFKGTTQAGEQAGGHQQKLDLAPFADE